MTTFPKERASLAAAITVSRGISSWSTKQSACANRGRSFSTSAGETVELAPAKMMMAFSPALSTVMKAWPVGTSRRATQEQSTPAAWRLSSKVSPAASRPTAPTMATGQPSRPRAKAWLAPFPPGLREIPWAAMVSPGWGIRSKVMDVSRFKLPTTTALHIRTHSYPAGKPSPAFISV